MKPGSPRKKPTQGKDPHDGGGGKRPIGGGKKPSIKKPDTGGE